MSAKAESGQGRIGFLIGAAVLGVAIFLAVKFIPVRIAVYEFRDFVQQECRYAAVRQEDEAVAKRILEKAQELEIPLRKKDLRVQRTPREMTVSVSYDIPVDLKVTTYHYKVSVKERAPLF